MKKIYLLLLVFSCLSQLLEAQVQEDLFTIKLDGQAMEAMVTEEGDTIILAELKGVSVTSKKFNSVRERRHHYKMRYHAVKVYSYGVEAIRLFKEVEEETAALKKGKSKKYVKNVQKELKEKFEEPLKKLTRTQGRILIKMIERELDQPMYDILKALRGSLTAGYWNQLSKIFGYDLKEGYSPEQDPILEVILRDLDVSHEVEANVN